MENLFNGKVQLKDLFPSWDEAIVKRIKPIKIDNADPQRTSELSQGNFLSTNRVSVANKTGTSRLISG